MSADQFPCVFAGRSYELFRKTDGPGFDCVPSPEIIWTDLSQLELTETLGSAPLGGAR